MQVTQGQADAARSEKAQLWKWSQHRACNKKPAGEASGLGFTTLLSFTSAIAILTTIAAELALGLSSLGADLRLGVAPRSRSVFGRGLSRGVWGRDLLQSWWPAEKALWPGPDQAAIPNRPATKAA